MGLLDYSKKLAAALSGYTPDVMPPSATGVSAEKLNGMTWDDLYGARLANKNDPQAQADLAPYEHQAWAREQGRDNPVTGLVTGLIMNPVYQAAKYTGADKYLLSPRDQMTTPASWAELLGGARGGLLGVADWARNKIK